LNPSAKVRQLEIPIMPTTKPKNKKAVAVKSGGRVSVKQGKAKEKPQKQEAVFTLDELGALIIQDKEDYVKLSKGRHPETLGLTISEELCDDECGLLYRIYTDENGRKIVGCSDHLRQINMRHASGKDYDGKEGAAKLQSDKSRKWASLIALCATFNEDSVSPEQKENQIGRIALHIIAEDISATFGKKPDVATEAAIKAGGAYTAAFNTLLQATGQKPKPGVKSKDGQTRKQEESAFYCVTGFVRKHGRLPNQRWLHSQLENLGYKFVRDKGRGPAEYRSMLGRAGFSGLPE